MEAVVALAAAVQGVKHFKRVRQDCTNLGNERERPPTELMSAHELLSCLVDCVYAHETEKAPEIREERLGYRLHTSHIPDKRCRVFERCDSWPNGDLRAEDILLRAEDNEWKAQYRRVKRPKYIVAVRGTIMTRPKDIIDDGRVVVDIVCGRPKFYKPLMDALKRLHSNTSDDDGGVWVAGHSLGAVVALVATFQLAMEAQIVISPHLFNFPDVTMEVLAKKLIEGTANGLGAVAHYFPVVGGPTNRLLRWTGQKSANILERVARATVRTFSESTISRAYEQRGALQQAGYCTYTYVNQHDCISNEAVERGLNQSDPVVSLSALFTGLFSGSGPGSCHLIPPMILFTNHRGMGILKAHNITQWYLYPTVELTAVRYDWPPVELHTG